jgi:hypothetical protein
MVDPYSAKLEHLISLHKKVFDLNPALGKLYPVAIVVDGAFRIYDYDQAHLTYQFKKNAPVPMPIPDGVRAAFQLESYGGRIACVVTPDVFDKMEDYVTILHEFVHCYQYETCEQTIKKGLDIARQAQEKGNVMWEIEHPFPYSAKNFTEPYDVFLNALVEEDDQEILRTRKMLRDYLGLHDYEYMVWQEWKEGFARWSENLIKRKLMMVENKGGLQKPYSRVLFYAGGEAYISHLSNRMPALTRDLRGLFQKLYEI